MRQRLLGILGVIGLMMNGPVWSSSMSAQIQRLEGALKAGQEGAVEAFWQECQTEGTPLIDSCEDGTCLVTFVWRGDEATRHVAVRDGLAGGDPSANLMKRLGETDVWYRSYRAPSDTLTTYRLSPNDPLVSVEKVSLEYYLDHISEVYATCRLDPLNPNRFTFPLGDEEVLEFSVLRLPEAPTQSETKASRLPSGKVRAFPFTSETLDNTRTIGVYTPAGYDPDGKPYPLLMLFDGKAYNTFVPTPTILDNLIGNREIAPVVCVLVGNASDRSREVELPCNARFGDFLVTELLPWIQERWNVTDQASETVIGGSSYGGLAAFYHAFEHPNQFGKVLCQSGAFFWHPEGKEGDWFCKWVANHPKQNLEFYLDVGQFETVRWFGRPDFVTLNRRMKRLLEKQGYEVAYAEFSGGHDYVCWRGTLADGLRSLLGPMVKQSIAAAETKKTVQESP